VSDLIVTHGGLNTIYESIFFRVPILVYPYNDSWDQRGNMARVVHHNIGLGGDIIKDTVEIMKAKIEFLLESQDVKHQLTNLSKVISKTHFYDDILLNK
jgi:UDP:flavonoid glycosyltransferase YjiC (YdhE family)